MGNKHRNLKTKKGVNKIKKPYANHPLGDWRRGHKKKDNKNIIFIFILVFIIVLILFLKLLCKKPYQPATLWVTGGDSQKKRDKEMLVSSLVRSVVGSLVGSHKRIILIILM